MKKEIEILKSQAHAVPKFYRYNETLVRDNTNCYSHALGLTYPSIELYRIGAISQKKDINDKYKSIEEIKELLFLDCKELQIEIEESSFEEKIDDIEKQYKIALFVKIYADNQIFDYHFWRYDGNQEKWTEKWRKRSIQEVDLKDKISNHHFYWKFVGVYKISK